MSESPPQTTRRLLIAGLDGATWTVLDPMLKAGRLPVLARLCHQGSRGDLASVWPPISAAAWASMMTGLNPGRHGVFDFRNLDLSRYAGHEERLSTAADIAAPTLFDHVGAAGSVGYQVPLTYPPWPIHGVLVAGYPTPDRRTAYTSPPEWGPRLGTLETHTADQVGRSGPAGQLEIYRRGVERLTDNVIRLSQEVDWRLLMYVTGAPDGAQHRFFKFATPDYPGVRAQDRERFGPLMGQVMEAVDTALGRILNALPDDTDVIVISDHCAIARPRRAFHANAWLASMGWLEPIRGQSKVNTTGQSLIEWAKQSLPISDWAKQHLPLALRRGLSRGRAGVGRIDWSRTRAYRVKLSHPIEGIHLNVADRQPHGVVRPEAYHALRQDIMAALQGRPEILKVAPRERVFQGTFLERAPDILFQLHPEFDGGAGLEQLVADVPTSWLKAISGYHDLTGIFVASGPHFRSGEITGASLLDITPTALHALGLTVPADLDGRVLTELFRSAQTVSYGPPVTTSQTTRPTELSPADQAGIEAALRALGYID